tara:strand:- start:72 stop:476 length:405 start_codon:yes stop_codon:yes gene_type:complete
MYETETPDNDGVPLIWNQIRDPSDTLAWWEENLGCAVDSRERYRICQSCPNFINLTKQCKLCGCLMFIKCRIPQYKCPDNPPRWGKSQRRKTMSKNSPHYVEGIDYDDPEFRKTLIRKQDYDESEFSKKFIKKN